MIRVNLLPEEYRKAEKSPIARIVALTLGLMVNIALVIWLYSLLQLVIPKAEDHLDMLKNDKAQKEKQAEDYDSFIGLQKGFQKRTDELEKLWQSRVLWSEKLYQLASIMPKYIGLIKIDLEEPRPASSRRVKPEDMDGGSLVLEGISAGAQPARVGYFINILEGNPPDEFQDILPVSLMFADDFKAINVDDRKLVDFTKSKNYVEEYAYSFKCSLILKYRGQ